MSAVANKINRAILGKNPLVYIHTAEEERVMTLLAEAGAGFPGGPLPVYAWSCVSGFANGFPDGARLRAPADAVAAVCAHAGPGVFVMPDLAPFMGEPQVQRGLREFYQPARRRGDRFIFILASEVIIPRGLRREMHLIEAGLPDAAEIAREITAVAAQYPRTGITAELQAEMTLALKGMTLAEIGHVLHRICGAASHDREAVMAEIYDEKEMAVGKSGLLEFCAPRWRLEGIGGLTNLKEWLLQRRELFSNEALDAGVPIPKGLLIMGVSGCGKSLAIKTISALWNVPLFRLDTNLLFSGSHGSPEAAFHAALRTVEAVAPAILWIDEIENSLGMDSDKMEMSSHIFSSFLTWMQEKPPLIFIAATANRIQALPAEIIRKGRFDQIFFVDLPDSGERREILEIYLRRNGADPANFDMQMLTIQTNGWSGAEIEQAVVAARIEAYAGRREFNMADMSNAVARIVPLSKTMEDQIKAIRDWAFDRATPASKRSRRGG